VFFASFDQAERAAGFSYGVKRGLGGHLDQSGFRFLSLMSLKLADRDPITGASVHRISASKTMIGYEAQRGALSSAVYLGWSVALHPRAVINGQSFVPVDHAPVGLIDFWYAWSGYSWSGYSWPEAATGFAAASRFSSLTLMADAANQSIYLKARHGFALPGSPLTLGPEASISAGEKITRTDPLTQSNITVQAPWRSLRLGVHLGNIALWRVTLGLSAGAEHRLNNKIGAYGGFSAWVKY
jgi:hypothetical protein